MLETEALYTLEIATTETHKMAWCFTQNESLQILNYLAVLGIKKRSHCNQYIATQGNAICILHHVS